MLSHDGRNGARDEIPLRIQRDRYHGLELEITLGPVFNGSYVVIVVVLKGDADERGNGVRQLFSKILSVISASGRHQRRGAAQNEHQREPTRDHWDTDCESAVVL